MIKPPFPAAAILVTIAALAGATRTAIAEAPAGIARAQAVTAQDSVCDRSALLRREIYATYGVHFPPSRRFIPPSNTRTSSAHHAASTAGDL